MTVNRHRIVVAGLMHDLDRDWKRIRFSCAVPDCLTGALEGAPAAGMDGLVQLLVDHHGNDDDTTPLFGFP